MQRSIALIVSTATAFSLATGVASADDDADLQDASHRGLAADIRYTEYGIPHIKAANFAGLGYGFGFAVARDNICVLADTYVTVSARRSRYFGPDGRANSAFGSASNNLNSDLYFQQVIDSGVIERALAAPAPLGPRAEAREIIRGYVAGYNRYLRETGVRGISDPACRGAEWVRPITEMDLYRHFHAVAAAGSSTLLIDGIASAAPPSAGGAAASEIPHDAAARVREALDDKDMGSNAIAVGGAATNNRRGLLLGNPHFPWQGGRRFWQAHLTVPGRMDVSGASLLGIPGVQIGFNRDVAWSHTVATPRTFGFFQLRLASPTSYLVDGKPEPMTSRRVRVEVRGANGTSVVERTLYSTRYGPVVSSGLGLPLSWTRDTAFALGDANLGNLRGLNTWFEFAGARSTRDLVSVLRRTQGVPWVNTIAADQSGNALYANIQVVPHVTDEQAARCSTPLGGAIFPGTGLAILDGSRTDCAWGRDPDALVPGIFGPSRMPLLNRSDYVENSNDSAWLTNPRQPITGYPRIIGDIATERDPRTRMGITSIEQQLANRRFSMESMKNLLFSDRSWVGEQAAEATARMCAAFPGGKAPTSTGSVDVGSACTALSNWDRRMTTASRGGLLFERYWLRVASLGSSMWLVPFDPRDPVGTPNTLNTSNPLVQKALGDAIADLRAAGIDPRSPLGEHHYVVRNGKRIGIHGGADSTGVLNMINPVWTSGAGNTEVAHGSSHIQVVSFTGGHCPDASTLLTYSQSSNPNSRHYSDQTSLFSAGRWVRARFCERDVLSSPELRVVRLR
jgi:acyl-homoserine-lactone acylase